jgi:hypothetical protein
MNRRERQRARSGGERRPHAREGREEALGVTRWTVISGVAGVVSAGLGFFFLSQGSISMAPALLLAGFLVFFPLALVK